MQSRQFSHWLLVVVQALRVFWALVLRLVPGCGPLTVGICQCEGSDNPNCWRDQLAFRTEVSSLLVYILLASLTCSKSSLLQRSHLVIVLSVIGVQSLLLWIILLFPNATFFPLEIFSMFAAALYRVLQAVLFMDGAYELNDYLYANAVEARRRLINSQASNARLAMMISVSIVLLVGSLATSIYLCIVFPEVTWCVVSAIVGSTLLLMVSITSWCEHGSLMTSAVMFSYSIYLCCQVARIRPTSGVEEDLPTTMLGLLVPAVSLTYFAISKSPARHLAGVTSVRSADGDDFEVNDFLLRIFVHFLADFYVTSVLAPRVSWLRFNIRAGTIFVCLLVYGWTLVAPKILSNRSF